MDFKVIVQIEDRDYQYELELGKLLKILDIDKSKDEILDAVRECLKT